MSARSGINATPTWYDGAFGNGSARAFGRSGAAAAAAPHRAVYDERALDEEEGADEAAPKTLREKLAAAKRSRAKAKAGREFSRQFESSSSDASQGGPRAAVYKGEMGQTHRRAARMQDEASPTRATRVRTLGDRGAALKSSPRFIAAMGVLVCLVFTCLFLYTPAQQYYQSVREHDRLQAEYSAVAERNEALQYEVNNLNSEAGVEARAREEFGWVKEGENAAVVYGLEKTESDELNMNANIIPGSVEAPETWYSPVLDVVFGVK